MSIFTQQKKPATVNNPLADLNEKLSDLQARQTEALRLLTDATDELMPLLTSQRRIDQERPRLVAAKQSASYAVQEAKQALARSIGKPEESTCIETLEKAEQALSEATQALATLDASFDRVSATSRVLALRETIQVQEQNERELKGAYTRVREQRKNLALVEIYSAYQHVFEMFQFGGAALYELRNDDPHAYDQMFLDLRIDEWQMADFLVQLYNPDEPDYRPELKLRQLAIKERLDSLTKKK